MEKKYVATIMNRLHLGDNNFLYYLSHTAIGDYNSKTKIFRDRNGQEYLPINEPGLMMSEVSTAYANLSEMETIPRKVGQQNMKDAIAEYNYLCGRFIYYVSRTDDNSIFCAPLDYIQIKENLNRTMEELAKHGGIEKASEKGKITFKTSTDSQKTTETERKKLVDRAILTNEVRSDIAAFLLELSEGVYTAEELKQIRENIRSQQQDIESLLQSIDSQMNAEEKEESIPRPVRMKDYIDINDLFQKVTKTLIAQDEPAKRVITEIARKEQHPKSKSRGLLITGQTGSGKTKMMELIAKYIGRPFLRVDSTQLTIPGYVGRDIEEVLWELYKKCGCDINKAKKAIIYFDEIDKKGSSKKDDISGKGVLNVLLPFIEGTTYQATESMRFQKEVVPIDTSEMTKILGGAFTDVYKELTDRKNIGFGSDTSSNGTAREAKTEDFVEKGQMPDELMGRVSVVKMNDLDIERIKRILRESDESAVRNQQQIFQELGVKLTASEEYLEEIAQQALKRKTGARGINNVVDETTWVAYGDVYSNLGEYEEIILQKETVSDPKIYQRVLKKESK